MEEIEFHQRNGANRFPPCRKQSKFEKQSRNHYTAIEAKELERQMSNPWLAEKWLQGWFQVGTSKSWQNDAFKAGVKQFRNALEKCRSTPFFARLSNSKWLDEEKEERDWEKEVPNVTERSFVTTSKVSPSQLFDVLLVVVVWNVSLDSSTRKPVEFSKFSLRMSSVMQSPTPSMQRGRLSLQWMSSTLWRGKDAPSTDSVDKMLPGNP